MRVPVPDSSWLLQVGTTPAPTQEPLTYSQPVDTLPIIDDARWSAGFTDASLPALLVWIVMLVALQFATWPIIKQMFRHFPDLGWGFSRLVTLIVAAFVVWFPSSVGLTYFRAVWCWLAVLVLAAGAWIWNMRKPVAEPGDEPPDRKSIGATEVTFWIVFAFFLILRLINPDSYEPIWGGEKAMEFAHINSILRSAEFPPVDPWYAGGYLNYYYYGSYLVAFMMKLTGIPSEIAFNLALPTVMALLATGVFSIGLAIGRSFSSSRRVYFAGAIAATIFTLFIGNLVDAARTWESLTSNDPRYLWDYWVWGATRIFSDNVTGKYAITEFPYFSALYGDLHAHLIAMPVTVLVIGLGYSIWLDLRNHSATIDSGPGLMAALQPVAFRCLLLGIVTGSLFMTNAWDAPTYAVVCGIGILATFWQVRPLLARLVVSGMALFIIAVVAYIAIFPFNQHYVALFSEIGTVDEKTPLLPVEAHWGVFLLMLTVGYASLGLRAASGHRYILGPIVAMPLLMMILLIRWIAVDRSTTVRDVADFATVLVVAAIWLVVTWKSIAEINDFDLPRHILQVLVVIAGFVTFVGMVTGRPVFALYVVIGGCAGIAWLTAPARAERFLHGLVACGMLLGAILELFYLVDDLTGGSSYRMNTVFKFYNQMWILFAIASAGYVAWMIRVALETRNTPVATTSASSDHEQGAISGPPPPETPVNSLDRQEVPSPLSRNWARAGLVVTAFVTFLGFAYPVQATVPRLDTRFPHPGNNLTLDAYAWMNYAEMPFVNFQPVTYADDLAAIDWFNSEVPGHHVIAEAAFGTYRCNGSRFSIATGLPAVIGWERHEQQQRDRTLLPQRVQDMRQLYASSNPGIKREIIDRYDISYIIVGQTERIYPQIQGNDCLATDISGGIAALESMVGTDLEIAFTHGTTTVYRVTQPAG